MRGSALPGAAHTAAMNLQATGALQASVDGWARRTGHAEQPARCRDFLDQVDHAQRSEPFSQRVDGLLDALLLLGRQARRQRLLSTRATGNGRGLVDLSKTRTVAVDRCPVNAKSLDEIMCSAARHRLIAKRA